MKTYIVTVPENDSTFVTGLFKKLNLQVTALSEEELEEVGLAEEIIKGMKSKNVPTEKLLKHFRKNGIDC